MNILYNPVINIKNISYHNASDYQSDMLFHGLKNLDHNIIDTNTMWWMYKDYVEQDRKKDIWGNGFTVYGLLQDNINRHANYKFDKCIIPIHHTMINNYVAIYNKIYSMLQLFDGHNISIVDGWDRAYINDDILNLCKTNHIKYFKRELVKDIDGVFPITFAIPEEKINQNPRSIFDRHYDISPLIPVNQSIDSAYMSTYIYKTEAEYYNMYNNSVFAFTSKKGGWDTLRHYEILANGCLPIFVDIENCPKNCLWNFPKELCVKIKNLSGLYVNISGWENNKTFEHCGHIDINNPGNINKERFDYETYINILTQFRQWLLQNGTTKALANYVLGIMNEY